MSEQRPNKMNPPKIKDAAVDLAINAACDALTNDLSLTWIGESSLTERAYYFGLYKGLEAISGADTLRGLSKVLIKTLWARSADDTFLSTQLGRNFAALEEGLQSLRTGNSLIQQQIDTLFQDIKLLERQCHERFQYMQEVLHKVKSLTLSIRQTNQIGPVEDKNIDDEIVKIHIHLSELALIVRWFALLETHHEMSKRFK